MLVTSPPIPLQALFDFSQGQEVIKQVVSSMGTAVSGPLGAMVITFFSVSLLWTWVKEKFDTWSFWELFLRLFVVAAGIAAWNNVFFMVDNSLNHIVTLFGRVDSSQLITQVLLVPMNNMDGLSFNLMLILNAASIFGLISMVLYLLAWVMYNLNIVGAYFSVWFLYMIGPLFLVTWLFAPLHDLWMRWVRFYLTIKVWLLVMNSFLFLVATFLASNLTTNWVQSVHIILVDAYLFFLIVGFGASFPIARGLVGGAANVFGSGNFLPGMAAGAATAGLAVGGMAVGAAAGGPVGAGIGSAAGGGAGKVAGSPLKAPGRQ